MIRSSILTLLLLVSSTLFGQDYYLKKFTPYQPEIPSPDAYPGYPVGSQHTRHDLIVSKMGKGPAVLFSDNLNFRGSWYGTNRLFLNALFLGSLIEIPKPD